MKATSLIVFGLIVITLLPPADAVAATSAYWRHEEGTAGGLIAAGLDTVVDSSGNFNDMRTFDPTFTSATYTSNVSPLALRSGLANTLSLDFGPGGDEDRDRGGFDDDNYSEGKPINTQSFSAMTVELAFNADSLGLGDGGTPGNFQALFGKDGGPLLPTSPIPPFKMAIRGDEADGIANQLSVEWIDGNGVVQILFSGQPVTVGDWNHVAFTLSPTNAELWIAGETGPYTLVDNLPGDFAGPSGNVMIIDPTPFTVGRGAFGNGITDWANALIDEVRLTDEVLTTEEFLFVTAAGPGEDADFDGDGDVDGADFLTFQRGLGAVGTGTPQTGDADGDTNIDADDLAIFREQFGATGGISAVPEPSSAMVALAVAVVGAALSRRRCFSNRFSH